MQTTCRGCGAFIPAGATACERCGWSAHPDRSGGESTFDRLAEDASWHGLWKWLWVFWTIAYPLLIVGADIQYGSNTAGRFASLLVAGSYAWPWLVGVITLGVLYTVTRPGERRD